MIATRTGLTTGSSIGNASKAWSEPGSTASARGGRSGRSPRETASRRRSAPARAPGPREPLSSRGRDLEHRRETDHEAVARAHAGAIDAGRELQLREEVAVCLDGGLADGRPGLT